MDNLKYIDFTAKFQFPIITSTIISCKDIDILKSFLELGADINNHPDYGFSPLMILATNDVNVDSIRLLLDYGADINAGNRLGCTALMGAISAGLIKIIKLLLEYGADIHLLDHLSISALEYAVRYQNEDILLILQNDILH